MLPPQCRNGQRCKSANCELVLVQQVTRSKCQVGAKKQVVDARENIILLAEVAREVQKLLYCWLLGTVWFRL